MACPICQNIQLKQAIFYGTEIDYCPKCLGLWFEEDELRQAKDAKDKELNWLDIPLWKKKAQFRISKTKIMCPVCSVPLYSIKYSGSEIEIDLCNLCRGIWLDRGEFKKIMDYLKEKGQDEVLKNYFVNLLKEGIEVFTGPETFKEEFTDLLTILKILNYKFTTQHPMISKLISLLPK